MTLVAPARIGVIYLVIGRFSNSSNSRPLTYNCSRGRFRHYGRGDSIDDASWCILQYSPRFGVFTNTAWNLDKTSFLVFGESSELQNWNVTLNLNVAAAGPL